MCTDQMKNEDLVSVTPCIRELIPVEFVAGCDKIFNTFNRRSNEIYVVRIIVAILPSSTGIATLDALSDTW